MCARYKNSGIQAYLLPPIASTGIVHMGWARALLAAN